MRQGKGFIIVYAIDDRASFEEVEVFHRDLTRTKGTSNVPVVICGNKCDLEDKRVVSKTEGEELAAKLQATFFETSALANINIENAFRALVKETRKQGSSASTGTTAGDAGAAKKKKKGGCVLL
jgi:GTPase SAR1 family protein